MRNLHGAGQTGFVPVPTVPHLFMPQPQKLDALTSLRFFAAAMIVIGHAHPIFGSMGIAESASLGLGVSFFFVLSGFILAYNYPVLETGHAVRRFWLARFARVWPLHAVTCLLWIAVVFNFDREAYFPGNGGWIRLLTNVLLVQAWIPLHDWILSFNGVSWSLSVEFFFYASFPFLVRYWGNSWQWILFCQAGVVAAFLAGATLLSLSADSSFPGIGLFSAVYFNPLVRVLEFSVGISVAFVVRRLLSNGIRLLSSQWFLLEAAVLTAAVIGMLAAADFAGIRRTLGEATAFYFTREGVWLIFALLIGVFAVSRGPVTRVLSTRVMVFLGEISFALYLCHAMVIRYLEPYANRIEPYRPIGYPLFWAGLLVLSAALFLGVEQPARRLILKLADTEASLRKELLRHLKPAPVSTGALAFLSVAALCAVIYKPSTIFCLDDAGVNAILAAPSARVISGGATFDGRYTILGVQASPTKEGKVVLNVLIRAETALVATDIMAVHLNDGKNMIIDKPGDVALDKSSRPIPAGVRWVQSFVVENAVFEQSRSIGIAMYRNPSALFDVRGGEVDWGGKRLLVVR